MTSTDRPARRRRTPEERREQVALAARAIARRAGLVAVTQRAVADEAGMTSALVAHYAPGMDELVADTFTWIVESELAELETLLVGLGPIEAMRTMLGTLLDGSRDDVTLVWVHAWAIGPSNDALAARVRAAMDAWQAFVVGVVSRGVERGDWTTGRADAGAVAWLVLGLLDGLNAQALVHWRAGGGGLGAGSGGGTRPAVEWRGQPAVERRERLELAARAIEGVLGLDPDTLA